MADIPLALLGSTSTHTTVPRKPGEGFTDEDEQDPSSTDQEGINDDNLSDLEHDLSYDTTPSRGFFSASGDPEEAALIHSPLKRTFYDLLENPTSSSAAITIHIFCTSLIVVSALITILETLPPFHSTPSSVWFGLETALVVSFTVEYLSRLYAHSENWATLWNWASSFFAIIDLLAILPYYIEIAVQADTTAFFRFSILRTFRLLRVFRPFRYNSAILLTIEVMYLSMQRSKDALYALGFFVLMAVVLFSTLLYFAERGTWDDALERFIDADGDPSQFSSIPAAAWFVLVTITTVGYGEIIPRSFLGRLITIPLLLFGLLLIALPSFVLGREFSAIWDGMAMSGRFDSTARARSSSLSSFMSSRAPAYDAASSTPLTSRLRRPARVSDPEAQRATSSSRAQSTPSHLPPRRSSSHSKGKGKTKSRGSEQLTNRKLARNQQVLSAQIEELGTLLREMRQEVATLSVLRGRDAE